MLFRSQLSRTAIGETPEPSAGALRYPAAFAFAGSGCLLVLEIVAGRVLAPTLGVSLYTWTSVIGVVLGGVSLGNYLGGWIADRWPTRSVLGLVYAAAAASLLVLALLPFADSLQLPRSVSALLQVLWLTAVVFLLPATVLGAPTTFLTRLALDRVDRTGRVVGRIQAAAALGSIAGTFLTGFLLISWIGTRHIVAAVAGILFLLALLARPPWIWRRAGAAGMTLLFVLILDGVGLAQRLHAREQLLLHQGHRERSRDPRQRPRRHRPVPKPVPRPSSALVRRSEERRVGKECRL